MVCQYILRGKDIVTEALDGEVVIIDLNNGSYYSLEGCGGYVWECLVQQLPVSSILHNLQAGFPDHSEKLSTDVEVFLKSLLDADLIVEAEELLEPKGDSPKMPETCDNLVMQCYSDMQELLMLDPIHEVEETGWPKKREDAE